LHGAIRVLALLYAFQLASNIHALIQTERPIQVLEVAVVYEAASCMVHAVALIKCQMCGLHMRTCCQPAVIALAKIYT
jgi:hypothetical protein